ncbi:MAG: PEP-CTERM system TPR-repeat protein PrsT, partial [Nitrosospira sp.]|nr:PEP-CTERM system TPR-repeat protein PrsT [Nitrosospira sp.]
HYLRSEEKQKALSLAQSLQSTHRDNPNVLDLLAQAQFANDDKAGALESYNKIAATQPKSALAQFRIASVHMAMQNSSAASDALKKALAIKPDYVDAQLMQAMLAAREGNHEQALAIARQIQKQEGKSAVGYIAEGDLLMEQKNPALAAKAYERALTISKSGPLMVKLHTSLRQSGKAKEANSRLLQWLKEHPDDAFTGMYLAGVFVADGANKAAIEQYRTILRQHPTYMPALNNLAWLYQKEKDPQALEYAEKAYQLAGENPATLDTLGWILVEQGNTARGLPLLRKAVSLVPEGGEIQYHLAVGLVKAGEKTKARKELEQLLDTGKNFASIDEAKILLKQLQ